MGLILPVVAYLAGRGTDAHYISTRYNTEKHAFLAKYREKLERCFIAIEDLDRKSGRPGQIITRRDYFGPAIVFEEDRSKREALQGLIKNCTIVITEMSDLCRARNKRSAAESEVYKAFAESLTPVVLASGFKCKGFSNDFDEVPSPLNDAGREISKIINGNFQGMGEEPLLDIASKITNYTMDINARIKESTRRLN